MSTNEISVSLSDDQLLLYELSFSIGRTLDPYAIAHDFLKKLFERKSLVDTSIWWKDGDAIVLLGSHPADGTQPRRLPLTHPYWQRTRDRIVRLVPTSDPDDLTKDHAIEPENGMLIPLGSQGVLVIHSASSASLGLLRMPQAIALLERLATAIEGANAHVQLQRMPVSPPPMHADAEPRRATDGFAPLLHALKNALPDLVWLKDPQGVYIACNARFEHFFGASEREIIGRTDYDFVSDELADLFRKQDQLAMKEGGPTTNEEWVTFADDGHAELLETTKTPVFDASGVMIGVLGIGHDITERKRSEEAIRAAEERSRHLASMLRLMCDNVPDMIWAKGLDKRYLFANKAICENLLCANNIKEPLGKTDLFFAQRERAQHPENPHWHTFGEMCQDSDAITLERGVPSVFEEFGNVKGRYLCLEVHKSPFVNANGEVIGTVGCARDISDRKRIEAELDQHRQHLEQLVQQRTTELLATEARASLILQSAADGLYGVDTRGEITFINPAACRMLGYEADDVIGQNAHTLFHHSRPDGTPFAECDCPGQRALATGCEVRVNNEVYWHAQGHAVPVMYAVHPMQQDGQITGAVVSFIDVTEQRAAEQARERALIAAEHLARVKSEFLANMSHEIRTPLNGILGFAQIGCRQYFDSVKARSAFEKIHSSGNRLLGVVNDVLDFSKIEAGRMSIAQNVISLGEVIDHAVELVLDRVQAKRLDLVVDKSPTLPANCIGDGLRIGQVLLNVLSNAVKFTEAGQIQFSAWCQDEWLCFRVTDTGIGITAHDIHRIFDPFHQVDGSSTRRFDGTGLGLAISKRILELMSGSIQVTSTPGQGSTFEIRLPYIRSNVPVHDSLSATELLGATGEYPLSGISILVAEDDAISRLMLEYNLLEDGATVIMVENGREAVEHVLADGPGAYDVVLMDVQMPEMDGYEATRRILEIAPGLPIIGQTAHAFGDERDRCFAAGMVAHIAKPIETATLVSTILDALASRNGR